MAIWEIEIEIGSVRFSKSIGENYPCESLESVWDSRFTGPHFRNLGKKNGVSVSGSRFFRLNFGETALCTYGIGN
jgi:hypothetical protein